MKQYLLYLALLFQIACGAGIPITVTIDQPLPELNISDSVGSLIDQFRGNGFFGQETTSIPEKWPSSLPNIRISTKIPGDPVSLDLGTQSASFKKYLKALKRLEINHLIYRVDASNANIDIPELTLFLADKANTSANERRLWKKIGHIPGAQKETTGDYELEFTPGGQSLLMSQFTDDEKSLALKLSGNITLDTEKNPYKPTGVIRSRLIVILTIFISPEELL